MFIATASPALAIDDCGSGTGSDTEKTITCDASNYNPQQNGGSILYVLSRPSNNTTPHAKAKRLYRFNISGLKGDKAITGHQIPNFQYVDSNAAGIWLQYSGTRHMKADISDIELKVPYKVTGKNGAKGIFLWLENHLGNRYTDGDHTNRTNPLYIDPRNLTLNVSDSEFHTYQEAVSAHSSWNGNITVNVRDTQIRTYTNTGSNAARLHFGSGIVGFHNAVGDVTINAERVDIVTRNGDGIYGGVWGDATYPEPAYIGKSTIDLNVTDSDIQAAGAGRGGVVALHKGDIGEVDISLVNSRIATKGGAYGIAVIHGQIHNNVTYFLNKTSTTATHKLDVRIKIDNSDVVTEDAHGIYIDRSARTGSIGKNTIISGSRVRAGGANSNAIRAQGDTDITVIGRISAESGHVVKIEKGDLVLKINGGSVNGRVTTDAAKNREIRVLGRLIASGSNVNDAGPAPSGAFDIYASEVTNGFLLSSRYAPRTAVYESLPGVLLRLDGPGVTVPVRMQSPDSSGQWRVSADYTTYRPSASSAGGRYGLLRLAAVGPGMDFALREDLTGWLAGRLVVGDADISAPNGGGRIRAQGLGPVAGLAWERGDGVYATGRASLTWYEVDYSSVSRGKLKSGANALVHSIGMEVGQRIERKEKSHLTRRAWLNHSGVSMNDFTDTVRSKISLADSDRLTFGIGLDAETEKDLFKGEKTVLLRGSLGVERRISGSRTRVRAFKEDLVSEGPDTGILLGASATWQAGPYLIQGAVSSRGLGSDGRTYKGSLTLRMDF